MKEGDEEATAAGERTCSHEQREEFSCIHIITHPGASFAWLAGCSSAPLVVLCMNNQNHSTCCAFSFYSATAAAAITSRSEGHSQRVAEKTAEALHACTIFMHYAFARVFFIFISIQDPR